MREYPEGEAFYGLNSNQCIKLSFWIYHDSYDIRYCCRFQNMRKIFRKAVLLTGITFLSFFEVANFNQFNATQLCWVFVGCFIAVLAKYLLKPIFVEMLNENKKSRYGNNQDKQDS